MSSKKFYKEDCSKLLYV